ncbi:hypothetical protein [Prolixibacter sp. NT017]|uniref:hypothetical protein n=1 Tax=Prolixibacter sp. NT017 TaxID=2652390 RepID=UPI00126D7AE5|nr:hypothetical protein [Prolixibacter sp. NT017]GET24649.1 hypothetical protein NT017_09780 [Prolixibacter sp. NT017]
MKEIYENYIKALQEEEKQQLDENQDLIYSFIDYCKDFGVKLSLGNFHYDRTIGIIAEYPEIVKSLHPNLNVDKENLVNYTQLENEFNQKSFNSGYFYSNKTIAMASHFFRRNSRKHNGFAPRFIDIFCYTNYPECEKFISLDYDRLRVNIDSTMCLERDTWYGAKFNRKINEIPDGIVKLRPPLEFDSMDIDIHFANAYSLDIKWYTSNNIKTFQLEEFKQENSQVNIDGKKYHPVKYLHAEYDLLKKTFRHFDGAIHFYTEREYLTRRDSDLNHNDKFESHIKTLSTKLFKLNGAISIDNWVELSSHFLTGNALVFEYFEGQLPSRILELIELIRNKN